MKNIKFLFVIGLMLSLLAGSAYCKEPNSAERVKAEELVNLVQFDQMMKDQEKVFANIIIQQHPKLAGNEKELGQIFHDSIPADFKEFVINLYAKNFSEEEISEMVKFYQSPVGKKALTRLPAITQETLVYMQKSMDKTKLQNALNDLVAKIDAKETKEIKKTK
jgi:hypothetical protein